jgi:hypothetical protein
VSVSVGYGELIVVTAAGAVINAEHRFVHDWSCVDCRMLEYEKRVRLADRLRKRQLYFAQQESSSNRRS